MSEVISLMKIKQDQLERLQDRLRGNGNKLTDAMSTIREQEIQLQIGDDMISNMMMQTEALVKQFEEEISDLKKLIYELEECSSNKGD